MSVGKLRELVEAAEDPKAALLKQLGTFGGFRPQHCQVLTAIFPGSKYHRIDGRLTKIERTDRALQENEFQGNVFLVVQVGPGAFQDGPGAQFFGQKPAIGDWVVARASDGMLTHINGVPCRVFDDSSIKGIADDPEAFW